MKTAENVHAWATAQTASGAMAAWAKEHAKEAEVLAYALACARELGYLDDN